MGSAHFTLLTPIFTAGVDQARPELRVPSIKGQLRWWARAVLGNGRPEYDLFGGIKGKRVGFNEESVAGPFVFRLVTASLQSEPRLLCPHDQNKGRRNALRPQANATFELHWSSRLAVRAAGASAALDHLIRTWLLLGSVGCRANRAAGSVWPAGYEPTVAEFQQEVAALSLPAHLAVRVLGEPVRDAEVLRSTATDTLQGQPPQTGNIRGRILGDVLGYVEGRNRKASALKLKVGRFSDGYRLIAAFDLRVNRATKPQFQTVADQLNRARKPLGRDLNAALAASPL